MLVWLLSISYSLFVWGAPSPGSSSYYQIEDTLKLSRFAAADQVRVQGDGLKNSLKQLAFDKKASMDVRWKSFMVYVEVEKEQSLPMITKALNDSTWFMRSAGLTALNSINKRLAQRWAYKIMQKDSALLVRMKAFEVLKDSKDSQVSHLFWKKLFSEDSQYKNQSLWIRGDIARTLLKDPKKEDHSKWVQLLHDKDKEMQMIATQALQELSSEEFKDVNEVSFWKEKYPNSQKF